MPSGMASPSSSGSKLNIGSGRISHRFAGGRSLRDVPIRDVRHERHRRGPLALEYGEETLAMRECADEDSSLAVDWPVRAAALRYTVSFTAGLSKARTVTSATECAALNPGLSRFLAFSAIQRYLPARRRKAKAEHRSPDGGLQSGTAP